MIFKKLNKLAKQLDYWDIKMSALASVCIGLLLARYVPELVDVNPWWWITLAILLLLRPLYHIAFGKEGL